MVTVGNLRDYIQENLDDGTLTEDDVVYIGDDDRSVVQALFNDAHELNISCTKSASRRHIWE